MKQSWSTSILEAKKSGEFAGEVRPNEPLAPYTTYRIGGPAELLVMPQGVGDLGILSRHLRGASASVPITILGKGSNCLISDAGLSGIVIRTQALDQSIVAIDRDPVTRIRVGASVSISTLLNRAAREGWGGLELWAGIPGSLGGAVHMNAGTKLGWSSKIVRRVERFDLATAESESVDVTESQFAYRKNLFLKPTDIVVGAEIVVRSESPDQIRVRLQEYLQARSSAQPVDVPSCGSVFKNPGTTHAWQVIEQLGLKGHQIGGAQISPKHANFIVNVGRASSADVLGLIRLIQLRAYTELGLTMEPEVRLLGFESIE